MSKITCYLENDVERGAEVAVGEGLLYQNLK